MPWNARALPANDAGSPQIGPDAVSPLTTSAFDLPDRLIAKGRPGADRRRRTALRGHRGEPRAVDRGPVRPPRRRAEGTRRHRPEGTGPGHGDPPDDRAPAHAAPLRSGPVLRAHRRRGRPRARLCRAAWPQGQRGPAAADRLAFPRGRALLRGDPREPDGPGKPAQVSLDPRPDQRLLGRGVHPGRSGRAGRSVLRPRRTWQRPAATRRRRCQRQPRSRPGA
jgi:hypothetical protein